MAPNNCVHTEFTGGKSFPRGHFSAPAPPAQRQTSPPSRSLFSYGQDFAADRRETIEKKLSFLLPVQQHLRSLLIVGSTVFGSESDYSDLDVVIISTMAGYETVCGALLERELELGGKDDAPAVDFTVLTQAEAEKLFQQSSPFAYSIRYGVVLFDDGFLSELLNRSFSPLPDREYYTSCLFEKIIIPYYTVLRDYREETRTTGGFLMNGSGRERNIKQTAPEQFARLIIHMLYVTLPAQGMIPLTKSDIIHYAGRAYGSEGAKVARKVLALARHQPVQLTGNESGSLKKFAVRLFREILRLVGINSAVRTAIGDAINMVRGSYHSIRNEAVRNCVV